ncbi:hypothetical protein, partial [Nodularia sp. LEGE 04288]|uniref:hypothetical protein n=1 Tax=Nodularia sp. LEGE 04288 TaxID=1828639 RepID=UPI001D0F766F
PIHHHPPPDISMSKIRIKLEEIILHLQIWRWAAMHSPMIRCFPSNSYEPAFSSLFICLNSVFRFNIIKWDDRVFFQLEVCKPRIFYNIPYQIVHGFSEATGISVADIDGIPF